MSAVPRVRRSLIFAPGDRPALFPKALACGADQLCIELEDGVPRDKAAARENALEWFAAPPANPGVERLVRINTPRGPEGLRDLLAICEAPTPPPAIMVPKVESPEDVRWLCDVFSDGAHSEICFHIIIETNRALEAAHEIAAASPRIDALAFGAIDMAAELRAPVAWEPLLYARQRLVNAAAGAGVDLLDAPCLDLDDEAALTEETRRARDLGFTGRAAVHPRQVPVINAVFSPDDEAVAYARRALAAAEAAGGGLVVLDGKLIEPPVLRSLRRVAAIADRMEAG